VSQKRPEVMTRSRLRLEVLGGGFARTACDTPPDTTRGWVSHDKSDSSVPDPLTITFICHLKLRIRMMGGPGASAQQEIAPNFCHHSTHDLPALLECLRKLRKQNVPPQSKPMRSTFPESPKISLMRSSITSPPTQTPTDPSKLALWCPNRGFNRAGGTSFVASSSIRRAWTDGWRCFQLQKRVPPAASGIYPSGSQGTIPFLRIFCNTPRGLRTWRGWLSMDMGRIRFCEDLHSGGYPSL